MVAIILIFAAASLIGAYDGKVGVSADFKDLDGNRLSVYSAPSHLTAARTCYDHMAGAIGVALHDRFKALGWLRVLPNSAYDVAADGARVLKALGVDVEALRVLRRRFAFACLDWSERQPHFGGALGAALLQIALKKKWVTQELDSRALRVTNQGRGELRTRFGITLPES